MGRRFPEFCTLTAVCRVSSKASPSAAGGDRVASYQAAINSVAARYYADWPFMVEVLNKWLETNQDFVRDPIGYATSNSSHTPPPAQGKDPSKISTIKATSDQIITSIATTPAPALTQISSTATGGIPPPLPIGVGSSEHLTSATPTASTCRMEPKGSHNPPSPSSDEHDAPVPVDESLPFYSFRVSRSLPSLWNLGLSVLSSVIPPALFGSWLVAPKPFTRQASRPSETCWFGLPLLAGSYKRWWGILKKPFALRSGEHPNSK